jgi:hypothetical protein
MTTTKSVVQTIAGDSGTANDHMMEVEEETSVTASGTNLQPQSTVGIDHAHTQDMEDEEEPMTATQGAQATQVGLHRSRHGLDTVAAHRIVARLGGVHDDDIPGSGDNMPGFGQASLITTTDSPSPLTIDWASLGQSEFDLPGTSVSASRSRPDTQLVINLETLGRSDVTMPGDDAGMEVQEASAATTVPRRPRGNRTKSANSNRKHAARQY